MRLVDAEPIEKWLLSHADQVPGEDPYRRVRICAYRHAFETLHSAPTVETAYCVPAAAESSKDLLTLEELREMDGEPVWVVNSKAKEIDGFHDEWALVSAQRRIVESASAIYHFEDYGEYWLAYRRKPGEGVR